MGGNSQSNMKTFISQTLSLCAHNVSWKVNVQTLSELSHLAEVCPVWCGHQWSEAHLDTLLSPSKDNPDTLSLVRARFLLLLWLRVLQVEDKHRENNSTKWWDKNNLIYTNKHTCHPHTASTWPCCHILLLPQPICCKKLSSLVPPLILFCLFLSLSPCFFSSPPPLHHCCCICLQSQTAAGGQSDMPLKPEEFTVGDSTGEKLIVFPSIQSTPSVCHVNLCLFLSPSLPPSFSPSC